MRNACGAAAKGLQKLADEFRVVTHQPAQHLDVHRPGEERAHIGGWLRRQVRVHGLGQPAFQQVLQLRQGHGFAHVVVHARILAALGLGFEGIGCEGQDTHRRGHRLARMDAGVGPLLFLGTNHGGELVAVHARHVQVGHDQGVVTTAPAYQRLQAIPRQVGRKPQQRQLLHDDLLVDLVVFGHQDQAPLAARLFARQGHRRSHVARGLHGVVFIQMLQTARRHRHRTQQCTAGQHFAVDGDTVCVELLRITVGPVPYDHEVHKQPRIGARDGAQAVQRSGAFRFGVDHPHPGPWRKAWGQLPDCFQVLYMLSMCACLGQVGHQVSRQRFAVANNEAEHPRHQRRWGRHFAPRRFRTDKRQAQREGGTRARGAGHGNAAAHALRQIARDSQAQARAPEAPGGGRIRLGKGGEQRGQRGLAHADSVVDDLELQGDMLAFLLHQHRAHGHPACGAPACRELDGVVDQVDEYLAQAKCVTPQRGGDLGVGEQGQLHPLFFCQAVEHGADFLHHLAHHHGLAFHIQVARLDL